MASGELERAAEYDFSSSEGMVAGKCVEIVASKAEIRVGTEAMSASTCSVVDFLTDFC